MILRTGRSKMQGLTLAAAAAALREGKVIVFPTETFYGLGCDAMNPEAVGKVFSVKKRALNMPLPVVIATLDDLDRLIPYLPEGAKKLADAFWPGPLSLVLPALPEVPDLLTANAGRIAVRFSPHPAVARLREETGMALVASSANISGMPSVSRIEDLDPELLHGIAGIYDDGPAPAGDKPSTVVDVIETRSGPVARILREGAISAEDVEKIGVPVLR